MGSLGRGIAAEPISAKGIVQEIIFWWIRQETSRSLIGNGRRASTPQQMSPSGATQLPTRRLMPPLAAYAPDEPSHFWRRVQAHRIVQCIETIHVLDEHRHAFDDQARMSGIQSAWHAIERFLPQVLA